MKYLLCFILFSTFGLAAIAQERPAQIASQAEVNAGTDGRKIVTPKTLANSTIISGVTNQFGSYAATHSGTNQVVTWTITGTTTNAGLLNWEVANYAGIAGSQNITVTNNQSAANVVNQILTNMNASGFPAFYGYTLSSNANALICTVNNKLGNDTAFSMYFAGPPLHGLSNTVSTITTPGVVEGMVSFNTVNAGSLNVTNTASFGFPANDGITIIDSNGNITSTANIDEIANVTVDSVLQTAVTALDWSYNNGNTTNFVPGFAMDSLYELDAQTNNITVNISALMAMYNGAIIYTDFKRTDTNTAYTVTLYTAGTNLFKDSGLTNMTMGPLQSFKIAWDGSYIQKIGDLSSTPKVETLNAVTINTLYTNGPTGGWLVVGGDTGSTLITAFGEAQLIVTNPGYGSKTNKAGGQLGLVTTNHFQLSSWVNPFGTYTLTNTSQANANATISMSSFDR